MGDHFKSPAPTGKIWNPINNPYEPNICSNNKIPEPISAASSPLALLAEQVRRKRSEASRISPTPPDTNAAAAAAGVLRMKGEARTFPSHPSSIASSSTAAATHAAEGDECALDLSTKNSRQSEPTPLKTLNSFDPLKNCSSELRAKNSSEPPPFLLGSVPEGNGVIGPVFSLAKLRPDSGVDQYDQSAFKDNEEHPMKLFEDLKEIRRISPQPDDSPQAEMPKLQNPNPRSDELAINPFREFPEKIPVPSKFDNVPPKSVSKRKMFTPIPSRPDDGRRKPFLEMEDSAALPISPRFDDNLRNLKSSDTFPKAPRPDHKPPMTFTDIEGSRQIPHRLDDIRANSYTEPNIFGTNASRVDSNYPMKPLTDGENNLLVAARLQDNHTEQKPFLNSSRSDANRFQPFPEISEQPDLSPPSNDRPIKKDIFSKTDDSLAKPFPELLEENLDMLSKSDEIPVKFQMRKKKFSCSGTRFTNPFSDVEETGDEDAPPQSYDVPTKSQAKRKLHSSPSRTEDSLTKPFPELLEENLEVSSRTGEMPTKKSHLKKKIFSSPSRSEDCLTKSFSELEGWLDDSPDSDDEIPAKSRRKRKIFSSSSRSVDSSVKSFPEIEERIPDSPNSDNEIPAKSRTKRKILSSSSRSVDSSVKSFPETEEHIPDSPPKSDNVSTKSHRKRKAFSRSLSNLKKTFSEMEERFDVSPKSDNEIPTEGHTNQNIFALYSSSDDAAVRSLIETQENLPVFPEADEADDSPTKTPPPPKTEASLGSPRSVESPSKTFRETEGIFPSSPQLQKTPKKRLSSQKSEQKKKSPMSPPVSSLRNSPMYKKRKLIPKSPFATARRLKLNPDLSQSTPTPSSLPSRSPSPEPTPPTPTKTSAPVNNKHTGRMVRRMPSGEPLKWIKRLISQPVHSNKKKSYKLLKKCTPCCVVLSKLPLEDGQKSVDLSSCSERFTDVFNKCSRVCRKEYGKIHNPWIKALQQRMKRLFAVLLWGQTPKFISIRMESLVKSPRPPKSQPRRGPSLESATPGKRRFFLLELKRKTILIPVVGNKMGERAFELDNPKNIGILYNIAASLQKSSEDEEKQP